MLKTTLVTGVLLLGVPLAGSAAPPDRAGGDRLPAPRLAERAAPADVVPPPPGTKNPKLASALQRAAAAHAARGKAWRVAVPDLPELLVEDDRVLVEMRVVAKRAKSLVTSLERRGVELRHHNVPSLIEAWVPVSQLAALAAERDVLFVRPARQVVPLVGSVDSQEVAASSADLWHAAGITGAGVTLGNIDGGYQGFAGRQASGDWPAGGQLTTFDMNGGLPFGAAGGTHGTSTLEINFDMAPGAQFVAYETSTVGDWYDSLVQAPADGVDVVSVSLGAFLDGVGDGSECAPHFPAPCGSIAEAAGIARAAGVLVVNAAGNERNEHWGGLYNDLPAVPGTHNWGTGTNVLQSSVCVPAGFQFISTLHWDDWNAVNHDYELVLVRRVAGPAWQVVASSANPQTGVTGSQTPQEFIVFTASTQSPNCPVPPIGQPALSNYGWVVQRTSAATNRNLQLFSGLPVFNPVNPRSLGFPADSPNVLAVGAVDVISTIQESYSSEGPVLGPGGGLGASTILKPDVVSVANVATVGGSFNGTSAATPHVAGIAALLLSFNPSLSVAELEQQIELVAAANDLGAAGYDLQHGHGLVRFGVAPALFDGDGDGILDDGDGSGIAGDNPCAAGATAYCDDNCVLTPNARQADADGDGRGDACDNCQKHPNGPVIPDAGGFVQRDTNLDGYGNMCDADYDNNGVVDNPDVTHLRTIFGSTIGQPSYDPDVDSDADGVIGDSDYLLLKLSYQRRPGPSALKCAGIIPCPPHQ